MTMRKAVVILPGYREHDIERQAMADHGLSLSELDWGGDRERLAEGVADAEIVFVRDTILDRDCILGMRRARGIVRYGVGVDTIDRAAAAERNIIVARVPDYGADIEVADHAVALFLAVKRRIVTRDRDVRRGLWQIGQAEPIGRIAGMTAGFIGYGRIARAVAARLRAFGIGRCLAFDPYLQPGTVADVDMVDLETLAAECGVISLHAPASAANHHIVGEHFLSRMRPDAILINTARGPLIDEAALAAALASGRIFGAGIDVFETEPPLGSPLLGLPNVVLSDHAGWYSEVTVANLQRGAAEQAGQILTTGTASQAVSPGIS